MNVLVDFAPRAQDFAPPAWKAIADPNVELHVKMTGLERFGDFMDAAKRGLPAGEAGHSTDYEMSLIARTVANGYAGSVTVGET
jgi:hypothetical protein